MQGTEAVETPQLNFSDAYIYDQLQQEVDIYWSWSGPYQSFKILRSTDPAFSSYADVTSNGDNGGGDGSYYFYDYSALYGVNYYYKVAAVSSQPLTQSLSSSVTAPAVAPVNVVAVYGGANDIQVHWNPVSGTPSEYDYYILDSSGNESGEGTTAPDVTSVDVTANPFWLQNGETYTIAVQAYTGESGYGYVSISNAVIYSGSSFNGD